MPPKKAPAAKKSVKPRASRDDGDDDDGSMSVSQSDLESEVDPVENDVIYKIQSVQTAQLMDLNSFLDDPKMINPSGAASTNIISRQTGKCYNIPEKKISKFFKLLEACRRAKIKMMMTERQQAYSGIMLDFDIYQDTETDQLTDEMFHMLCQKLIELLMKIINFGDTKKEVIHMGITRRPKITYSDEKDCYKDGFHIIIPGIKVSKGVKKLLINKLLDGEVLDQILADVIPAEQNIKGEAYQRKHFLDVMSVHVPVFFVGSSTKKGHAAYHLSHVYEATINFDSKGFMLTKNDSMLSSKNVNICNEFSLNYEATNGAIKKVQYEPQEKFKTEAFDLEKTAKADEEAANNFGQLSMNNIHDLQHKELQDLLDTLHANRAEKFDLWIT
jgi:hypothetical protein